ncbi:hypothetical protein IWQ60_006191 [Tieghemiomyces parasiticus]|uniref:Uncharacterized protein n=1 Tax=Tieghemiomyces parasiticus TaxID=78921 RepID=A0A9W8A4U7_9FUNG|nr:hypothetical protein IWQ60_006191 [Tieghemiomyces parasiticus]
MPTDDGQEKGAGSTLAISSPTNESIKGFVSIFGSQITKGELHIHLPKFTKGRPVVARIKANAPVVIPQLRDVNNYLQLALEHLGTEPAPDSAARALDYMEDLLDLIERTLAIFEGNLSAAIHYPVRRLDPPLPGNLVLEFFINHANFITKVHVVDDPTAVPKHGLFPALSRLRPHHHHHHPNQSPATHTASDFETVTGTVHQVSIETIYPYLDTVRASLAKAQFLVSDMIKKFLVFVTLDDEAYEAFSAA